MEAFQPVSTLLFIRLTVVVISLDYFSVMGRKRTDVLSVEPFTVSIMWSVFTKIKVRKTSYSLSL
jgi:hypothetical protein